MKIRGRAAFKVWRFGLLGNTQLFHAILCHGLFEAGHQRLFLLAYAQLQQDKPPPISIAVREERRISAKIARAEPKKAKKLLASLMQHTGDKKMKLEAQMKQEDGTGRHDHAVPDQNMALQTYPGFEQLDAEHTLLLARLESGELDQARDAADSLYGHGQNIVNIMPAEATLFRYSMNQMVQSGWPAS